MTSKKSLWTRTQIVLPYSDKAEDDPVLAKAKTSQKGRRATALQNELQKRTWLRSLAITILRLISKMVERDSKSNPSTAYAVPDDDLYDASLKMQTLELWYPILITTSRRPFCTRTKSLHSNARAFIEIFCTRTEMVSIRAPELWSLILLTTSKRTLPASLSESGAKDTIQEGNSRGWKESEDCVLGGCDLKSWEFFSYRLLKVIDGSIFAVPKDRTYVSRDICNSGLLWAFHKWQDQQQWRWRKFDSWLKIEECHPLVWDEMEGLVVSYSAYEIGELVFRMKR